MTQGRVAMLAVHLFCAGILACSIDASAAPDAQSLIAGVWRGNSVCAVKDSPCHDEANVYRISVVDGKPATFSVTAGKVVDGREIVMGTSEWNYDAAKHVLESAMPAAVLRFVVDGDRMDGTLSLRDATVYRRIHLVRRTGGE